MATILNNINKQLMPSLSMEVFDDHWQGSIAGCLPVRIWCSLRQRLSAICARCAPVGSLFQLISFLLVPFMFLILAAPQFANDKEGLALIVASAMGLRLFGACMNGKDRYQPSAIDMLVLLYLCANVIASFSSHYFAESLFGLAKLVVYIIAYFVFVSGFQVSPSKRITATLAALAIGATAVSLYGLYQYKIGVAPLATWEDPTIEDKSTRIFSTLGNPNLLAGYLVPLVSLTFGLAMVFLSKSGIRRWLGAGLLVVPAIITTALFLTGSRGGYVGLLLEVAALSAVSLVWLWQKRPGYRLAMVCALVLLPIIGAAIVHFKLPSIEHRFLSIFAGSEHSSNAYRLNVWRSSFKMFEDNWWLGIGTGNKTFRLAYGLYMRSSFDALGTYCVPLEVAVETGIPGLLAFGWLVVACLSRAHTRFWGSQDPAIRWLAATAAAAIIGILAHGLVDTVFYRPQVQFVFWLAISLLVALPDPNRQKQPE